jgi:hypothetical protein
MTDTGWTMEGGGQGKLISGTLTRAIEKLKGEHAVLFGGIIYLYSDTQWILFVSHRAHGASEFSVIDALFQRPLMQAAGLSA